MKTYIFIQARMNSIRLPEKVMKKIMNRTILEYLIERCQKIPDIDKIIILTGESNSNKPIIELSKNLRVEFFVGSEDNLLDRYYNASKHFLSDVILRITADCPLVDPILINTGLKQYKNENCDILTTVINRTIPHGLDFEIFSSAVLEDSWKFMRENYENYEKFYETFIPPTKNILENIKYQKSHFDLESNHSDLRVTLDYPEDFEVIRILLEKLHVTNPCFGLDSIVEFFKQNPEVFNLNKKYI